MMEYGVAKVVSESDLSCTHKARRDSCPRVQPEAVSLTVEMQLPGRLLPCTNLKLMHLQHPSRVVVGE
jgi:hypothetical protein